VAAERDELGARDAPRAPRGRALHRVEGDEVEPEALEAQLQVDRVHRVEVAARDASLGIDGAVGEKRHVRSFSYTTRSVRSTTREISSRLVCPSSTRETASSASERKPLA